MPMVKFSVGDTLITKKNHPCSSNKFTVMRLGSDIKLMCLGCQREIIKDREAVEKMIKSVLTVDAPSDSKSSL